VIEGENGMALVNGKPRLRGVLHGWACIVCVPLGAVAVIAAQSSRARLAVAIYAVSLIGLFGVSALYHGINWRSIAARRWMRRLDHSMIFVMIAGTYTPFAVLVLHGQIATVILIIVWAAAVGGVVLNLAWPQAPRWLAVTIYSALGWVSVAAVPQLTSALGISAVALLALGGALYSAGGIIYAIKRPDPVPAVFGYHEVFHALVIVAAALQCAVIAFWVLPA
jgi:hemolysin III